MENSIPINLVISEENLARPSERKDAAANRQAIMDAARDLFVARGVAPVTMADIAKEAGVGKGTLYRRFAHKGELCLALLDKELQAFQDGALAHLRQMTEDDQPYMSQLDYFLDVLVHFVTDNLPLMCEIDNVPTPIENLVHDVNQPHYWQEITVRSLLGRAAQAGEITPLNQHQSGLDLEYLASLLMAALNARTLRFQFATQNYTPERISHGLRQFVRQLAMSNEQDNLIYHL